MSNAEPTTPDRWATSLTWVARIVPAVALVVVGWCLVAEFPAIVHAHPAYPILLALTAVAAALAGWRAWRSPRTSVGWRRILRIIALALSIVWIAALGWLCPLSAQEPALAAMASDSAVTVVETPTQIVLTPRPPLEPRVFFQPGAKVDARAYAAVLRPLAEAGHVVVITKQPLGIAFLAQDAFVNARRMFPLTAGWVVGGTHWAERSRRRLPMTTTRMRGTCRWIVALCLLSGPSHAADALRTGVVDLGEQ